MNLMAANCPRCGKLYNKSIGSVCSSCHREIEKQYEACLHYLRKHKGCNIYELSEATDVSVRQITKFIREGRISVMDAPNMGYPCEVCGTLIHAGGMCDKCRTRLAKDVQRMTSPPSSATNRESGVSNDLSNYNIRQDPDRTR